MLPLIALLALSQASPNYAVLDKIPIPGDGGWDYLYMDSNAHLLYISRGTHEQVLDVKSKKIVADILDSPGVHGVALVPKLHKGYTSNGRNDTMTVFDTRTFKTIGSVKVGSRPDAIMFDPASNRVFTFNAGSQDCTAVDVSTDTVAGSVPLGGKPEFPQVDGHGMLYVNIEDKSTIAAVDTKNLKVTNTWSISPGEEASGLAIDTKDHLLFSTAGNNIMAISDYVAGKVVGSPKIGNGPDAGGFDPGTGYAFASNGQDGTITVIGRTGSGDWEPMQTVETQKSARTMALDTKTHKIYLIAAEFKASTDPNNRRRQMVPGSTVILVVGPK